MKTYTWPITKKQITDCDVDGAIKAVGVRANRQQIIIL